MRKEHQNENDIVVKGINTHQMEIHYPYESLSYDKVPEPIKYNN